MSKTSIKDEDLLINFATNNPDIDRLEGLITEFNPFKILGIMHHEIRYSNVLAWLLDPSGNHGLGDVILRRTIISALKNNELNDFSLSIADFIKCQFEGVKVYREYKAGSRRIDILIECMKPRFEMIIENKIRAKESPKQLQDCYDFIKAKYPNIQILAIFLSMPVEDPPSDSRYLHLSHEAVYNILNEVLELHKDDFNIKKYEFINYYLTSLKEEIMGNDRVRELAKSIYKKHHEAIEIINKYGENSNDFIEAAEKFLEKNATLEKIDLRFYWAWFVPKEFKPPIKIVTDKWIADYPIACWFNARQQYDKFGIVLEVGPIIDKVMRSKLLEAMRNYKELKIPQKPTEYYTRVFSKYINFDHWDEEERILEKMELLFFENAKSAVRAVEKVITDFDWNK